MKLSFLALTATLLSASLGTLRGSGEEWKLPTAEPRLKAGAGSELATSSCFLCHSLDYIATQPPLTRDQWKAIVTKMQQKFGAPLVPEKLDPLLDYLARNYGK